MPKMPKTSKGKLLIGFSAAVATFAVAQWMGGAGTDSRPTVEIEPISAIATETVTRDDYLPAPFGERRIVFLEEGEAAPSETAAFCDEANWRDLNLVVGGIEEGAFRVDQDAWEKALSGSKAGLASWMSQCYRDGAAIEIVSAGTGDRLAVYDASRGLRTASDL